ncbi:hypothetical protein ILYODFUR_006321, partial [Ilyodon furcidens]
DANHSLCLSDLSLISTDSELRENINNAQNLDLSNVTPIKIFELMFQSPENSISQDDPHPIKNPGETFCVETSAQPGVADASPVISFSVNPTSSSSSSNNAAVMEASSQHIQNSSSQAHTPVPVTVSVSSTQNPPFMHLSGAQQISDVPQAVQAPNHVTSQHYVALPPTFLQSESATQTSPLPQPVPVHPPVAPALTSTGSASAATTADGLSAVAQPVPLPNSAVTNTGPSQPSTPATINLASTPNVLQPSLVMSDQNLQWILSSAANSQQNPEQASHQGAPKVEKVFFTTAIPVGANAGNSVQQIGLSLPVIIIKQEETCQCNCACRDFVKDKTAKSASSIISAPSQQPTAESTPQLSSEPPHHSTTSSSSCCLPKSSSKVGEPRPEAPSSSSSSSTTAAQSFSPIVSNTASNPSPSEGLASMDVSDFLSMQSPETAVNIEALLLVADDFNMTTDSGS